METTRYIPIKGEKMDTYVFTAGIAQEEDGRWSAWIEALPGCATWGYTPAEALEALKEAAQAYVEVLIEKGRSVPVAVGVERRDAPAVTVMV